MGGVVTMLTNFVGAHWETLDLIFVVLGLVVYVSASHSLNQRRHPSAAIAWVLGILLVPYVTLPLYLAFGSRKVVVPRGVPGQRQPLVSASVSFPTLARSLQLGAAMGLPDPVPYDNLTIHEDGAKALQALRRIIASASVSLEISTFLLGRDVLGDEVLELLRERASAGVRVRLLIDGIGIYLGGYPDLGALAKAGIEVVRFVPPFNSPKRGRTNLRNHRKMVIADGERVWCGGRNLAAEYFEGDPRPILPRTPWIDLSFDLGGALASQVRQQYEKDWAFATEKDNPPEPTQPPIESINIDGSELAQLVDSGPDRSDDTIFTLLVSACFTSQRRILAVTPYFVPESSLLTALTLAARRGIQVDLVMPEKSNHRLADFARHRALRDLVVSGARVWLHPRMVHAKAILVDDELALVGSANLDGRSMFLNYEMMVAFYCPSAVTGFAGWVEARRQECNVYPYRRPSVLRELAEGLLLWLAFQL